VCVTLPQAVSFSEEKMSGHLFTVRPTVRPSVRLCVRPTVRPSDRPTDRSSVRPEAD
jgi:hypothetical protein